MNAIQNIAAYNEAFAAYLADASEKMQAVLGDGSTPMTMPQICYLSGAKDYVAANGFVISMYDVFEYFVGEGIFVKAGFIGGSIGYTL